MQALRVCPVAACAAVVFVCCGVPASVRLQPEQLATLHVGETAAVHVASDRQYSIGSAGTALALMNRMQHHATTIYIYRAVDVGNETLVATPRDPGPDGCASCVTVHYFIKVVR